MQKIFNKNYLLAFFLFSTNLCFAPTGDSYTLTSNIITGERKEKKPYVGVFADLMTSSRKDTVSVQFQYNVPLDLVTKTETNSGTVTHDSTTGAMAHLSTSTNTAGLARLESKKGIRYVPGHEIYAYFTTVFTTGVSDSTQWAGIFDATDGFAVGYDGATFSVLHRLNTSDTTIAQSSFNIDRLDGTGPSRITLDPTKINIFKISFGWLGTAPITFEICRRDGQWFPFHMIQRANIVAVPSLYNPVLPLTMEVQNSGNNTDLSLKTASWGAGVLGRGGYDRQHQRSNTGVNFDDGSSHGPKVMLALRNKSSFEGKTNRIDVHLIRAYFSATASTSFKNSGELVRFTFYKGSSITTGGSWSDHDGASAGSKISCIEYNTTATGQSGGTEVFMLPFANRESTEVVFAERDIGSSSTVIELDPGEDLVIIASTTASYTVTADISLVWHEAIS